MSGDMAEFDELLKTIIAAVYKAEGGNACDVLVEFSKTGYVDTDMDWTASVGTKNRCTNHASGATPLAALRSLKRATLEWYAGLVRESRAASLQSLDDAIAMLAEGEAIGSSSEAKRDA